MRLLLQLYDACWLLYKPLDVKPVVVSCEKKQFNFRSVALESNWILHCFLAETSNFGLATELKCLHRVCVCMCVCAFVRVGVGVVEVFLWFRRLQLCYEKKKHYKTCTGMCVGNHYFRCKVR